MKRRWLRISLLLGLCLMVVPAGTLIGGLWFVQSETFREDALPELIAEVEVAAGIEIDYESIDFDPVQGIAFQGFSVRSARPPAEWSLQATEVKARYNLDDILSERVVVEALEVQGATFRAVLPPSAVEAEDPPEPTLESKPLEPSQVLLDLHQALASLPLEVEIRAVSLGFDLVEASTSPGEVPSMAFEIRDVSLAGKAHVKPGRVYGDLTTRLGQSPEKPSKIEAILSRSAPSEKVNLSIYQLGHLEAALIASKEGVSLALPKLELTTAITELDYARSADEHERAVGANALSQGFKGSLSWQRALSAPALPGIHESKALALAVLKELQFDGAIDFSADELRLADDVRVETVDSPVRKAQADVSLRAGTRMEVKDGVARFTVTGEDNGLSLEAIEYADVHHQLGIGALRLSPTGSLEVPVSALVLENPKAQAEAVNLELGAGVELSELALVSDGSLPIRSLALSTASELSIAQHEGKATVSLSAESKAKTPKLGPATVALAARTELVASERYSNFSTRASMDVGGKRALSAMGALALEGPDVIRVDTDLSVETPVLIHEFPQYAASLKAFGVGRASTRAVLRVPLRDSIEATMAPELLTTLPVSGSLSAAVSGKTLPLDEQVTLALGYPIEASGTFSHSPEGSSGEFELSLPSVHTPDAVARSLAVTLSPKIKGDKAGAELSFRAPTLETPKLRGPVAAEALGRVDVNLQTLAASWDLRAGLNDRAKTHFYGTMVDGPGQVSVSGALDIRDIDRLMDELPPTSPLPANPPARLTSHYQLEVSHSGASAKELNAELVRAGDVRLKAEGELIPRSPKQPLGEHILGLWPDPISFELDTQVKGETAEVTGSLRTSKLEALGQGRVYELTSLLEASVPVDDPMRASMVVKGAVGRLEPHEDLVVVEGLADYLSDVSYRLGVESMPESDNHTVALSVNGRHESWRFEAEGEGDAKLEQARFDAVFKAAVPEHARVISEGIEVRGRGRVVAPIEVIVVGGREVVLTGKMNFQGVDIVQPGKALYGLNGTLELSQSLVLPEEGEKLRWSYVETVNPFKRVDTHKVQPYLHARQSLSFERAEAEGRAVGPFFGEVTWTQNLLTFANVDLELFGGVFVGESFVNLHTETTQVGMLGRLSDFDTSLLNPDQEKGIGESYKINARIASIYDINRSLAEGRMDVDRLKPEALINFMNVVDPTGENAAFNKARMALQVSHPESVRLRLEQGYADLVIQLGGVAPLEIAASHLPLRSILHEYGMGFQEKLRKVVPQ